MRITSIVARAVQCAASVLSSSRAYLHRLTLRTERAQDALDQTEARYGSLSLEYVEARELLDLRRRALARARRAAWTATWRAAWARCAALVAA